MRSYCAVYVDAGYLLASAATRITGSSLRRGVQVDYPDLITRLIDQVEQASGMPLLRVNWYDSGARPSGQPDYQQESIGLLHRVKLRLGRLSFSGDQKGVDVRIGLDLAIQGRHQVADVVYLVSGDDDLTEAVEEAQAHGVQVFVLAVPGPDDRPHGVSKHLLRESDGLLLVDPAIIDETVRSMAIPDVLIPADADGAEAVEGGPEVTESEDASPAPAAADASRGDADGDTSADNTPAAPTPATARPGPRPAPSIPQDAPKPAVPSLPTPAAFARKRATALTLPSTGIDILIPHGEGVTAELVDAVAKQVVASWCATSGPEALAELRARRPAVPGDLDRALLVDLANRSGDANIDEAARHDVRERFWFHVDRVRAL